MAKAAGSAGISGDGRYVVFSSSEYQGLPPPGTYLYDRTERSTQRTPVPGPGPVISGDGRFVAGGSQVWNRKTGEIDEVTGGDSNLFPSPSARPSLSRDGRFLAYTTIAPDPGEGAATDIVLLADRATRRITLASLGPRSARGDQAVISADGRSLAFAQGSLYVARPKQIGLYFIEPRYAIRGRTTTLENRSANMELFERAEAGGA